MLGHRKIAVSLTFPIFIYLKLNVPCKIYKESKFMQIIELAFPVKTTKVLGVGGKNNLPFLKHWNRENKNYSTSLEQILVKIAAQDHEDEHCEMKHLIQQIQPVLSASGRAARKMSGLIPFCIHTSVKLIIKKSLQILGFLMAATTHRPKKDYRF